MSRCTRTDTGWMLPEHRPDCIDTDCTGCLPCVTDQHGNPVRHCRIRRRCTSHLDWHEHACPRCLGKIRANLRSILDTIALMPPEAEHRGIDSEPVVLAGPHANRVLVGWHLINLDRAGVPVEELDERDPWTALQLRERMIREDLGHDIDTLVSATLSGTAAYLDWVLTDLARDERQVQVISDLHACSATVLAHVESVLRNSRTPQQGAPCPTCVHAEAGAPRLQRKYGHWCTEEACTREHVTDTSRDTWVCPTNSEHWWTHAAYTNWVEERGTVHSDAS